MNRLKLTRRGFLKASAVTAIGLPGCMSATVDKTAAIKPNFLFLFTDDQSFNTVNALK